MNTTLGVIYGLITLFGLGMNNALAKVPTEKIGPKRIVLYRTMCTSLILFLVMLFSLNSVRLSLKDLLVAIIIAIIGYIPLFFFYKAVEVGKIGVVAPVSGTSIIFTTFLATLFYHENLNAYKILSILVIVVGIILISMNLKDIRQSDWHKIKSGVPYAMIASVLWGLWFFLFRIPTRTIGPAGASFINEFFTLIAAFTYAKFSKINIKVPDSESMKYIVIIALCGSIGVLALSQGLKIASANIVAPVAAPTALIVVVYGHFVYHEKLTRLQYFAIFLILAGIVSLSYF